MDAKGFVVPPGGGSILSMAPGRSAALKLLGGDTGDSIMLFEETAPAGTETTFHLHRDSDEVAYVLSGEITFKIGDEIAVGGPGTCASSGNGDDVAMAALAVAGGATQGVDLNLQVRHPILKIARVCPHRLCGRPGRGLSRRPAPR